MWHHARLSILTCSLPATIAFFIATMMMKIFVEQSPKCLHCPRVKGVNVGWQITTELLRSLQSGSLLNSPIYTAACCK